LGTWYDGLQKNQRRKYQSPTIGTFDAMTSERTPHRLCRIGKFPEVNKGTNYDPTIAFAATIPCHEFGEQLNASRG
jgi:hypothetical protein